MPGVAHVELARGGLFRVQPAPDTDPTDALVQAAWDGKWNLFQLAPAVSSIEDVFVQLTHREEHA